MEWWSIVGLAVALIALVWQHLDYRRRLGLVQAQLSEALARATDGNERDPLTGLESRGSLEKRMEADCGAGVAAVLDLDDFRRLNELLGHLGGDEILRAIGRLLQVSIRQEDRAFRWGGDEFALIFSGVEADVARLRMSTIEERLRHFHIRNYGEVSIGVSWGIAATGGRALRDSLDEADRAMYASKRNRTAG